MNFLQRILSPFIPDCGHEAELHKLRNEVQAARLARQIAERENIKLVRENAGIVSASRTTCAELITTIDRLNERERELVNLLEEAQSTAAGAQRELLDVSAELADARCLHGDRRVKCQRATTQEITNQVIELAFRLVGIFFDDGPGRRHNWIMERGAERAKVPIVDKAFIERVAKREISFGAGDTLVGDFHVITWLRTNGDVDVEYRTCDVVKRIIAPDVQTEIPMEVASAGAH